MPATIPNNPNAAKHGVVDFRSFLLPGISAVCILVLFILSMPSQQQFDTPRDVGPGVNAKPAFAPVADTTDTIASGKEEL